MDVEINHYAILGLPSGEEGSKLSDKEITKAYRFKALELHPDKRPNDPNALANFQKLQTSYHILKDEKARKLFDKLIRVKFQKLQHQSQQDSKRRKMMSDLEERERTAFYHDSTDRARGEEERISRKLKEEISRIRAMHANKTTSPATRKETVFGGKVGANEGLSGTSKEKMLKVSWEKVSFGYNAERLRGLFETFGEVEDVVIRSSKKKGSALVVMATKEAAMIIHVADWWRHRHWESIQRPNTKRGRGRPKLTWHEVAATDTACGDLTNPLLVLPLQPAVTTVEPDGPKLNEKLVGAGHQAFEASVLLKLQEAAQRQE